MTSIWDDVRALAEEATAEVGRRLIAEFGHAIPVEKSDGTLLTEADRWADATLIDRVRRAFPRHALLTEEGNTIGPDAEWCWVIDPLDGTTNFARGVPVWAVSLGLLHGGRPVFGHVRVPPLDQSFHGFTADRESPAGPRGAYRNGAGIRTSADPPDRNHFFTICSRSTALLGKTFPCKIRMLGSAAHNYLLVASGAALGGVEATPKIWDLAGVWPILEAAGGRWVPLGEDPFPLVSGREYRGRSFPTLAAAREELAALFLPIVETSRLDAGERPLRSG